jgi:hypothetical protein
MQIQWINSANQAFGLTIEFVCGGLRQRERNREVLWFSRPNFSLSVFEKLSRCDANALSDVEHLSLLVDREALTDRLLVQFISLNSSVAEYFQEIDC